MKEKTKEIISSFIGWCLLLLEVFGRFTIVIFSTASLGYLMIQNGATENKFLVPLFEVGTKFGVLWSLLPFFRWVTSNNNPYFTGYKNK